MQAVLQIQKIPTSLQSRRVPQHRLAPDCPENHRFHFDQVIRFQFPDFQILNFMSGTFMS